MSDLEHMRGLIHQLLEASEAYYQKDQEIMSNYKYDQLYDELVQLEEKTEVVLTGSPTSRVGYEVLSQLPKEQHIVRMLSLDKTKERSLLETWLGEEKGILSWKLDGLTIVLTYEGGELVKGVTRGNGEVGEVITNNVKVFDNIPLKIPVKGVVVIRGEAVIKYSDFNKINATLEGDEFYKNPRNLCSGSVRQLNNEITAQRHVNFYGFQVVRGGPESIVSKYESLKWLESLGFDVVEHVLVTKYNLLKQVDKFAETMVDSDIASDGLVLTFDSIPYSVALGATAKFPRDAIAFKWQDEVEETKLIAIEWQTSRTGRMNPVAIFESVELAGSTISRASLHNLSIVEELELGVGDILQVYKANMIIPQVAENLTRSGGLLPPTTCRVCGYQTQVREEKTAKVLFCENKACGAKNIKSLVHYVSRNAMNIEGLSEAGIEKLIQAGLLTTLVDLYTLKEHKSVIIELEGFGEKSYEKLIRAIEAKRQVAQPQFIYALGIPNVGVRNAKLLSKHYAYDMGKILTATKEELVEIDGFGQVIAEALYTYFNETQTRGNIEALLKYIQFKKTDSQKEKQVLEGETMVVTGSLIKYENRKALAMFIESLGGKVTGSVTGKTTYLINNDLTSTSGKNKKAQALNVPIINETQLLELIEERQNL